MSKLKFPPSGNFQRNIMLDKTNKNKPKKRRSYALSSIGFTPETPLADLIVPDDCTPKTITYVNHVKVYLNSLTNSHNPARRKHNTSCPCAVCKLIGNAFQVCKALEDNEFLRDAVIKSSLYFSNEAKRQAADVKGSIEQKQNRVP